MNTHMNTSGTMKGFFSLLAALILLAVIVLPVSALQLNGQDVTATATGETVEYPVILDEAPAGLAGYSMTVQLTDPAVGEITAVTFPSWATLKNASALPADSVVLKAADLSDGVPAGTTGITLATLTLRADAAGTTPVTITLRQMDDDSGGVMSPTVQAGSFTVAATPTPTPTATQTPAPVADFSADPTSGMAPLSVQFTDLSTGDGISAWAWDFNNDGTIDSTEQNPSYIYTSGGSYTVKLTITGTGGNGEAVKTNYIAVTDAPTPTITTQIPVPTVEFSADPTSGIAPLTVQFTDLTTGAGISAWAWDFDHDGTTDSTEQNPAYTYSVPGTYSVDLTVTSNGFEHSATKAWYITVTEAPTPTPTTTQVPPPVGNFAANPLTGDAPLDVQFTDLSTGDGISAWSWDFNNDGSVDSTDQNPSYTYTAAGSYTVKLIVTGTGGNGEAVKTDFITVTDAPTPTPTTTQVPPPVGNFAANPLTGAAPLDVQFTDQSTGQITSWLWDVNNDGTAECTTKDCSYTYTDPGSYTVKLTVSGAGGFDNVIRDNYITVNAAPTPTPTAVPAPVAGFSGTPTSGTAPLIVQFTDESTGDITNYAWDFNGDIKPESFEKNPSYTYTEPGTYSVNLGVMGPGGMDAEMKPGYITVTAAPIPPPVAQFSAKPVSGEAPLTVEFRDESTGDITSYAWDFTNDGVIDSTDKNLTFTYPLAGTYTVRHTVTGPGGSDDEIKEDLITVTAAPIPAPVAQFSGTPTSGDAPLSVKFTDASTGTISAYAWDFENDGTIDSTEQDPEHVYGNAGTYTVNLTVTGPGGSDDETKLSYITVSEPLAKPVANFTADPVQGAAPLDVQFTDTSEGTGITAYAWDFENDGTVDSAGQNPQHSYAVPGVYTVNLTVTNAAGSGSKTVADLISVTEPAPVAQFSADPVSGDAPLTVKFTDASTGTISAYAWDFENDGIVDSAEKNPEHIYSTAGTYTVNLTVTGPGGSDDETKLSYITVSEPLAKPVANFTADPRQGAAPLDVQFTDTSEGTGITAYAWDFENDGTVDSAGQNPQHSYAVPGVYTVNLTVTNAAGSDSKVRDSYINALMTAPAANFTANMTSGYAPLSVEFTDVSDGTVSLRAWDFENDGVIDSTDAVAVHTYASAGNYTVNLTVSNAGGSNTMVRTEYIIVNAVTAPVVEFSANLTTGYAPLAVQFTDDSKGVGLIEWSWDFNGDNVIDSTEQNPVYTYSMPGTYPVSLAVKGTGGTTTAVKKDYIVVSAVVPAKPKAEFVGKPTSGNAPLTVKFTDKSVGKDITSWAWDFNGDGVTDSTEQNPSYTYTAKGSYNVALTVKNAGGSDTKVKKDYIRVNQLEKPQADFKADKQSGKAPLTVKFTDKSKGEAITGWSWDFNNDGTIDSTEKNPTYTYAAAGKYAVKLVVTNAAGSDMEIKSDYITVKDGGTQPPSEKKPVAVIFASRTWGTPPMTVKFADQSLNNPTSRTWFFGDGTSSTEKNPTHLYADPGIYFARLYVENSAGSDQDFRFIFVLPRWFGSWFGNYGNN